MVPHSPVLVAPSMHLMSAENVAPGLEQRTQDTKRPDDYPRGVTIQFPYRFFHSSTDPPWLFDPNPPYLASTPPYPTLPTASLSENRTNRDKLISLRETNRDGEKTDSNRASPRYFHCYFHFRGLHHSCNDAMVPQGPSLDNNAAT